MQHHTNYELCAKTCTHDQVSGIPYLLVDSLRADACRQLMENSAFKAILSLVEIAPQNSSAYFLLTVSEEEEIPQSTEIYFDGDNPLFL